MFKIMIPDVRSWHLKPTPLDLILYVSLTVFDARKLVLKCKLVSQEEKHSKLSSLPITNGGWFGMRKVKGELKGLIFLWSRC